MEREFQVGDRVLVIKPARNNAYGLVMGLEGTVIQIGEMSKNIKIDVAPDCFWRPSRFELVAPAAPVEGAKPAKKAAKAKPKKPRKPKKLPNKSLRSELRKEIAKKFPVKPAGLCSYAAKMENNAIIVQLGQPCHASIGYAFPSEKKVKELAYSVHHEVKRFDVDASKKSMNAYKKYLHYMLNESPWATCFLTKSVPVALRYDVLMDVSRSRNEIAGACIALREGTEYEDKRYVFEKVLDKGYSGHTAFLMSYVFGRSRENYSLLNLNRGHCVLSGYLACSDLFKLFKSGYFLTKGDETYSEAHSGYEVIRKIGRIQNENHFSDFIRKLVVEQAEGGGWNAKKYVFEDNFFKVADEIEKKLKEQA